MTPPRRRHVGIRRILALSLVTAVTVSGGALASVSPQVTAPPLVAAPVVAYAVTNSGALPYDAVPLPAALMGLTAVGAIATALDQTGTTVIATRSANGDIEIADPTMFSTPTTLAALGDRVPLATGDPAIAVDSAGRLVVAYVSNGQLIVARTQFDTALSTWHDGSAQSAPAPLDIATVAAPTATTFVGQPTLSVVNDVPQLVVTSSAGSLWSLGMTISSLTPSPLVALPLAPTGALATGSPILVDAATSTYATSVITNGVTHIDLISCATTCAARDLTAATSASNSLPALASASSGNTLYLAAITTLGHGLLLKSTLPALTSWSAVDVTVGSTAPALTGQPTVSLSGSAVTFGAAAANWGDFFVLTSTTGRANSFKATDASATGGSSAQSINGFTASVSLNAVPTFLAGGVAQPAPTGTGLYAIPLSTYPQAISDGWPVISDTGGLGTTSSPWVWVPAATAITSSFDFIVGRDIAKSHKRVTWISFWTVSGPLRGEPTTPATFYTHGFASGAAVATTIDRYRAAGLGLQPDWVALDPEGYPDYHSCLDGQGGSSACPPSNPANWAQMVAGWEDGLASVDPKLHPAIYASQYEFKNGNLANLPIPVFPAIAYLWKSVSLTAAAPVGASSIQVSSNVGVNANETIYFSAGTQSATATIASSYNGTSLTVPLTAPLTISHPAGTVVNVLTPPYKLPSTTGSNILGYIAFGLGSWCGPAQTQENFLSNAPWNGLYNTLQLNGGVYCPR